MTITDSYSLASILTQYAKEVEAHKDEPNIRIEVERKLRGKYYLIKCDYRDVPTPENHVEFVPQIPLPDYADQSPMAKADRNEYYKRDQENFRRMDIFVRDKVLPALKGSLGS
jgi:hypothetical protein